ncbi:MAG: DUF4276 family protein [Phycisphaerae bacterium]
MNDIAPIVEGHGDVDAVPALLRKIVPSLRVANAIRFPRSRLANLADSSTLQRAIAIAATNLRPHGMILLVIDADEDCAATLGPALEARMLSLESCQLNRVVLPVREFEAWIVGGVPAFDLNNPDKCGDLKGRIKRLYGKYRETADQARLTRLIDVPRLRTNSRSFRRLCAVIEQFQADRCQEPPTERLG